jgi:hypothetical protein
MTNDEMDGGTNRDDLVRRLELMETMIAEGRSLTTRCGWIFLLWGVVTLAGIAWEWFKPSYWIWPSVLAAGFLLLFIGKALQKPSPARCANMQGRMVGAIWSMMGLATTLYVAAAMVRHLTWQLSYLAAIFMFVGLAHAISAIVLRWPVQGAVAALWWIGALAMFFVHSQKAIFIVFPLEMFFGMVLFGLYSIVLDRRDAQAGNDA